jgi:hypothetical protein
LGNQLGCSWFPTGTGTLDGANIPVTAGTYGISLKLLRIMCLPTLSSPSATLASAKDLSQSYH